MLLRECEISWKDKAERNRSQARHLLWTSKWAHRDASVPWCLKINPHYLGNFQKHPDSDVLGLRTDRQPVSTHSHQSCYFHHWHPLPIPGGPPQMLPLKTVTWGSEVLFLCHLGRGRGQRMTVGIVCTLALGQLLYISCPTKSWGSPVFLFWLHRKYKWSSED